jgi:hypothetical protein
MDSLEYDEKPWLRYRPPVVFMTTFNSYVQKKKTANKVVITFLYFYDMSTINQVAVQYNFFLTCTYCYLMMAKQIDRNMS